MPPQQEIGATGVAPGETAIPAMRDRTVVASEPAPPSATEPTAEPATEQRPIGGIYQGSDTFAKPSPAGGASLLRTPQGEVTLNFVDADLREVVKAILGDTLGANYVMDPSVQGVVTLQTSNPVTGPDLVPVLESILAVNNAALVQSDGMYRVVPSDQAVKGSGRLRSTLPSSSQSPGAQVLVVPLQYASATEIEKILAPFAPPGGVLRVDPRRSLIVIGGSRADVASMQDIIETFDVDWLSGMSFGLFQIHSTNAKTMVDELEKVFGDQTDGPLAGVVRFVPIERLNAVLVISPRSQYVDRAKKWVERLDVGEDETPRLYVYYCENSRAEDIAGVLSQVFGGEAPSTGRPTAELAPGLQATSLGAGTGGDGTGGPSLGTSRQQPQSTSSPALDTASTVGVVNDSVSVGSGQVRIIADKVKNALVILAKPSDYRIVENALSKLDIVPLQVLIEATILEVTLNDTLRYGVEWFFKFGGSSKVALSQSDAGRVADLSAGVVDSIFPGFSYVVSPTQSSVKAVINALDEVSDVNVISSPQVFVLDNQTATLVVGDQVPIQTRTSQSVISADAPTVNSIEYRDTGVILDVTPRVNAGGLVSMEISQEVSNVSSETSGDIDSPTISQRKVETTVAVKGGETVALGGLIQDRREQGSSGLPWLSRLPAIGWLFGTKSDAARRTELLVLITPRVVGSTEQARAVTQELRSRLRTIAPLEERLQ